jgi:hypothetical protein
VSLNLFEESEYLLTLLLNVVSIAFLQATINAIAHCFATPVYLHAVLFIHSEIALWIGYNPLAIIAFDLPQRETTSTHS